MSKPLFHEAVTTKEHMKALEDEGVSWKILQERYDPPPWCSDGVAALHPMGCWSLTSLRVTGEDFCKRCDLYEPSPSGGMCGQCGNEREVCADCGKPECGDVQPYCNCGSSKKLAPCPSCSPSGEGGGAKQDIPGFEGLVNKLAGLTVVVEPDMEPGVIEARIDGKAVGRISPTHPTTEE